MKAKLIPLIIGILLMIGLMFSCSDSLEDYQKTHLQEFISNSWIDQRQNVIISFTSDTYTLDIKGNKLTGPYKYYGNTLILDREYELIGSRGMGYGLKLKGQKQCVYYFLYYSL